MMYTFIVNVKHFSTETFVGVFYIEFVNFDLVENILLEMF